MAIRRFNGQLYVPNQQLACYTNQIGANRFGFPLLKGLTTTHDSHPAQRIVSQYRTME